MQGIILRVEDRFSYILDDTGTFRKIYSKPSHKAGCEISIDKAESGGRRRTHIRTFSAVAACFVILVGGFAFSNSWDWTSYAVYVDVNPSVRLDVNKYDRVISQQSLNADGATLLSKAKPSGNVISALDSVLNDAAKEGKISDYGVAVTVVGSGDKKYKQLVKLTGGDQRFSVMHLSYTSKNEESKALSSGATPSKYKLAKMAHEKYRNLSLDTAIKFQSDYLQDLISGKVVWQD